MEDWKVFEIIIKKEDGKKPELAFLTDSGIGEGPFVGSVGETDVSVSSKTRRINLKNVDESALGLLKSGHAFYIINLDKDTVEPVSLM